MDCKHARLLLTFTRDRANLDAGDAQGLQTHLGQCSDCDTLFAAEQQIDLVVGQAMRAVPIPTGLKERLLTRLTPKRPPWVLPRILPPLIAACLLVSLGLCWHLLLPRQVVPLDVAASEKFFLIDSAKLHEVEQWFRERKVSMAFPKEFDEKRLESISIADHQGKRIARLFFTHSVDGRTSSAHVLVLEKRHFNMDGLEPSYRPQVREKNGFIYIIHTGSGSGSLEDLKATYGPG